MKVEQGVSRRENGLIPGYKSLSLYEIFFFTVIREKIFKMLNRYSFKIIMVKLVKLNKSNDLLFENQQLINA